MKVFDKINLLFGGLVAVLSAWGGEYWFLFAAFLALNTADYVTGWFKAYFLKQENSSKGLRGIVKKVGYWIVIAIAFFVGLFFEKIGSQLHTDLSFLSYIGWFTLATFLINEIRSILENLVSIGVDVPAFLIKGLDTAASVVKEKTERKEDK